MRWTHNPVGLEHVLEELDHACVQSLPPDVYWQRLRLRLADFGISRVADITGLDRIGFPVAQAVRPGARSNAVTQGKGISLEAAAVGAVLECLEMAAGETIERLPTLAQSDAPMWSDLAPGLPDQTVWPDAETQYVAGFDLWNETQVAVPRDLLSTDFTRDAPATAAPILRHSIGLGAGTTLGAAMMHGLCECIEADARLRAEAWGGVQRLALASDNSHYGPTLERVQAAGLRAALYHLPCKGDLYAVKASVMERPSVDALPLPATGYAARPCQASAIFAALAEALQARLAVISGAREDITQSFYSHSASREDLEAEWQRHGPATSIISEPNAQPATLRSLTMQVGPVFAVPLCWDPQVPLAIVRMVTPSLIADPMRLVPT